MDMERITGGVVITITDVDGPHTVTIYDGTDGRGISSISLNADYTLTITYTDGTSYTTPSIRGAEGPGITSIIKTSTVGLVDTYTITYGNGQTATFTVTNGEPGRDGTDGTDGVTFTPSVSSTGVISWTNDGGQQNPEPVNIMGPPGTMIVEPVSGSTPSIIGVDNHRYVCGECATLDVQAPASGCIDIMFTSGSTATVLTVTSAKSGVTAIKWPDGWDGTCEANTIYEINILDGEYGVMAAWM